MAKAVSGLFAVLGNSLGSNAWSIQKAFNSERVSLLQGASIEGNALLMHQ